jgi:uncharacterized membrane protein YkvA (DUF1232 family)
VVPAGLPRVPDRPDPDFAPALGYADDAIIDTLVQRTIVCRAAWPTMRAH